MNEDRRAAPVGPDSLPATATTSTDAIQGPAGSLVPGAYRTTKRRGPRLAATNPRGLAGLGKALLLLALTGASAHASTAYGSINNFDTVNDTGVPCHGFEIELEDLESTDITYITMARECWSTEGR